MVLLPGVKGAFGSEEYRLDREATACRRAGDWAGAIAALRQRKALMGVEWADDKLAKYLQQAGRFDEAMDEIQWLLDHSQARERQALGHQPVSAQQAGHATNCMLIHRAAALICRRAGDATREAQHRELAGRYTAVRQRLEPIARAEIKAALAQRLSADRIKRGERR